MNRAILLVLAFVLTSGATKPVVPAALDPAKAYILVEIHNVGPPERPSSWVAGSLTLARYDPIGRDIRGASRSPGTAVSAGEVLRVNLGGPVQGAQKPLTQEKTRRLYFVAVPPDRWVVEGVQNSTAFSLGSRMFVLEPGRVTDLGVFMPDGDWAEGESEAKALRQTLTKALFFGIGKSAQARPAMVRWRQRRHAGSRRPRRAARGGDRLRTGTRLRQLSRRAGQPLRRPRRTECGDGRCHGAVAALRLRYGSPVSGTGPRRSC